MNIKEQWYSQNGRINNIILACEDGTGKYYVYQRFIENPQKKICSFLGKSVAELRRRAVLTFGE